MGQFVYPCHPVRVFILLSRTALNDMLHTSPETKWCHEDASNMMFEALLEENGLDLDDDDARFIKALIIGDRTMCR